MITVCVSIRERNGTSYDAEVELDLEYRPDVMDDALRSAMRTVIQAQQDTLPR